MKESAGQAPPQKKKKLQGVLARVVEQGIQLTRDTESWAAPSNKLQGVLDRAMQLGKQVTGKRECSLAPKNLQGDLARAVQ